MRPAIISASANIETVGISFRSVVVHHRDDTFYVFLLTHNILRIYSVNIDCGQIGNLRQQSIVAFRLVTIKFQFAHITALAALLWCGKHKTHIAESF